MFYGSFMATFRIVAMVHNRRSDGRMAVSIRVTNLRRSAYISTGYYVTDREMRKGEVSDRYILADLNARIIGYERRLREELGAKAADMAAAEIVRYLTDEGKGKADLIAFGYDLAADRLKAGRLSIGNSYIRILNALCDYLGRRELYVTELDRTILTGFLSYLRDDRVIVRKVRGAECVFRKKGVTENTLVNYMTNLKTVYRLAAADLDAMPADPFRKLDIRPTPTKKRVLPVADLASILSHHGDTYVSEMALDVFRLSFYLCGCNLADLYHAEPPVGGRFEYCRQKTKDRRNDRAFISIAIPDEAAQLFEKYRGEGRAFLFSERYTTVRNFDYSVNRELRKVCSVLGIRPVTTYYARYMWANIARNQCGVSKDDVAMALNHVDGSVTDIYLQKDFSIVDRANGMVCGFIRSQCRGTATQG